MHDLLTPASVRALLDEHGLHPRRALGQHFLADPNTARRIARLASVRAGDRVLEIGPGIGSLTLALADAGAHVCALEVDRHLLPVLEEVVAGRDVEVVGGDALDVDLLRLLGEGPWASVSNLPYNVAVPVVLRILDEVPQVRRLLVMVQREVGERLAATPGSKEHGGVSLRVAWHARAELVGAVPATVFVPRPKVESVLVRIERRDEPPVSVHDPDRMFALVRAGFAQRRKTLRRALGGELGAQVDEVLTTAGVDPRARAETLDLPGWAAITDAEATLR